MVTYMTAPVNKLTLGASEYTNYLVSAKVTRNENGFDTATIVLPDTSIYPGTVTQGTTVLLEAKDSTDGSYTTLFVGTVRFVIADISDSNTLTLSCLSIGAGLSEMVVGSDYGYQSTNILDSITEIVTDATDGIIPNYVQKILGGDSSNYAFDTTKVETISDKITYINFPYKPADKCLNDLCDLVTAVRAGSSGPHWIVTYSGGTNYLRLKYVDGTQVGWTKYYGDSQANATLTYGTDYTKINLEKMAPEANYILYYGSWRKPSDGDSWTEGNMSFAWPDPRRWWEIALLGDADVTDDDTIYKVGSKSIKLYTTAADAGGTWWVEPFYLPSFSWDLQTVFSPTNIPSVNFYTRRGTGMSEAEIWLLTSDPNTPDWSDRFVYNFYSDLTDVDTWYHINLPCGDYIPEGDEKTSNKWTEVGSPDWSDIKGIIFYALCPGATHGQLWIDGLHIGGAKVCRVAALSDYTGVITRQRLIVDDVGKDDSLVASDDSGLMAQMAYSELLRLRTTPVVGTVVTPMIKDLLPGQWLYIQATDYRVTKITHTIDATNYLSNIDVTSDVVNARSRPRFEDLNKQFAAIRPEWQDRQASNIKAGSVDWRITRLVKTYA